MLFLSHDKRLPHKTSSHDCLLLLYAWAFQKCEVNVFYVMCIFGNSLGFFLLFHSESGYHMMRLGIPLAHWHHTIALSLLSLCMDQYNV